jgi:hypothetical protein
MAEIFTDEGLDYLMGIVPKGGAMGALALGAFTSQTPSTVPARGATLANAGIVEPVAGTGGYARVSISTGDWGAQTTQGNGRRSTAAQKSFPTTSAAWNPSSVNGNFIGVGTTVGSGVVIFAANFDDLAAANMNAAGLVLRSTPFWQHDG